MEKQFILIRTDGKILILEEYPGDLLHALQAAVGGFIETVRSPKLGDPWLMIVNENGLLEDHLEINRTASIICGHMLIGDVAVVKQAGTEDGEQDLFGLTPQEMETLLRKIESIIQNKQSKEAALAILDQIINRKEANTNERSRNQKDDS